MWGPRGGRRAPTRKPSLLVCARGCGDSKGFSSESIFSATRTRVFLLPPGGAGRAPRAGRAQHCPPYAAPWPPHPLATLPPQAPGSRATWARDTLALGSSAPSSTTRRRCEVLACAGHGVARQEHPRRGSTCSARRPLPVGHVAPVLGLRLQHWNKTQHYITFLFVHLNVYLELHFVRNLPSLSTPVN